MASNPIENANSYEKAIEVISANECQVGVYYLQRTLVDLFANSDDVSVVPIRSGGDKIGQALVDANGKNSYTPNPMRMSHYKDGQRLDKAICPEGGEPDVNKFFKKDGKTRAVAFAEAVVESQSTIIEAQKTINAQIDKYNHDHDTNYPYPQYHTFALVHKIKKGEKVYIPNLKAAFRVDHRVWVHGLGCDNNQKGRNDSRMMGVQDPYAESIAQKPYYEPLFN